MCCTPYVATIVAGVLCMFQCFLNLGWNVPLILGLSLNKTEILTLTPIDVSQLENPFAVYGITILLALINVQLLIFSCLLLKANHDMRSDWVGSWCVLILAKSTMNILVGTYFLYHYANDHPQRIAMFRIAALFSGIFFFWPVINLILFGMVFKRYHDIRNIATTITVDHRTPPLNDAQSPPLNDVQPPPYTPGTFISRHMGQAVDPSPITGWSNQPLLSFDRDNLLNE